MLTRRWAGFAHPSGLWRNPRFLSLWAGRAVSDLGSQVMQIALPLTGVLVLHATPFQMGLMRAVGSAPDFLLGFVAGAWVDRSRRRPLLIAMDVSQAIVVGSVPAAALLGVLRLEQLYVVAFVSAALALVFDVAAQSHVPALVGENDLIDANSKLGITSSLSGLVGPTLGGALVQVLTAPLAISLNGVSFLLSAVAMTGASASTRPAGDPFRLSSLGQSIGDGLRFIAGNRLLLALAVSAGLFNFFDGIIFAVYVLYATRSLAIPPAVLGAIVAAGGAGGLLGAVLAGRLARRQGPGPALLAALLVATAGELFIAFAAGPVLVAAGVLLVAEVLVGLGAAMFSINFLTLRQSVTPESLQGRVHATSRTLITGLGPVGALLGGVIGQTLGLRAPMIVGALGTLVAAAVLFCSPVRSRRSPVDEPRG